MQKYEENLAARINGNNLQPLAEASITVTDNATGLAAALYQADELTLIPQPLVTDESGFFGFKAANGEYTLTISGSRFATFTRQITLIDPDQIASSADNLRFIQTGTGAVPRNVAQELRERVSVTQFGAVGDGVADDTAAIQAALNACIAKGGQVLFPSGKYRTTATLSADRSAITQDPTQGVLTGVTLRGYGAGASQIVADHNGAALDYRGGSGAGWHSYFTLEGVGILKGNVNRAAGSVGLKITAAAHFWMSNFDIYGFEYGISGIDCLSGSIENASIRGNDHGYKFIKGTRSHPNNLAFRGVNVLNNYKTGGTVIKPSVFSIFGGSIESNGLTGITADPACYGLYVEDAGVEGSVGINLSGVYFENNNGAADLSIYQATGTVTHTIVGCSFLRFQAGIYATNNILFTRAIGNRTKLAMGGCGLKTLTPYVDSASRLFIAGPDAGVHDMGGNTFMSNDGLFNTGLARAIFAPIGAHHQLPFAALPAAAEHRNAIQYCSDGSGSSRPSIAVSDGAAWWQIVLGDFAGNVHSDGTLRKLPRGWTCARNGAGSYTITHNLNLPTDAYTVVAAPRGAAGTGFCSGWLLSGNTFEIYFSNPAGVATDMAFSFNMKVI